MVQGQIIIALCIVAALITVATTAGLIVLLRRRHEITQAGQRYGDKVSYAFIINPSKPQARATRAYIERYCESHGITNEIFIDTKLDKDGYVCAKEALERYNADVVIACGGDGTVRTAASAMSGTTHAFGIIPIGTGNLFARNMGIPVDNIEAAMTIATSHGSRRVDMGRMALLDSDDPGHKHGFLIIAGVGFDAQMIDDTDPNLKKSISWFAYFWGAFKHLFGSRNCGTVILTEADGTMHEMRGETFRTFMAGNCGRIPGFTLMPDARYNDGILDFETIDTTHGLWGWFNLLVDVIHQTLTRRSEQSPISQKSKVRQYQGSSAEIMLDKPVLAEVDGDILEKTQHIRFTVDHNSLIVRAPQTGGAVDATGVLSPITGSTGDTAAADANPVSADPGPVSGQPQTAASENTSTAVRADIPEQPGTGSSLLM
ncbi:diacylglycerol/lipid kinase family protein [Scardovia wiggsiae]|uniref:diacylglycerol/lipid kinase family protein n=1 Tax=Scardovia wiggsiae TaxID=230143 RepID=UPI00362F2B76